MLGHPNLTTWLRLNDNTNDTSEKVTYTADNIAFDAGIFGRCASFINANEVIKSTYANSAALRSSTFTWSFWMKAANITQTTPYLMTYVGTGAQNSIIWRFVGNSVEFYASGFTGTDPRTGSQITVADTNWHHIAYSYNGVTWSGYLDGVQIFSFTRTFTLAFLSGLGFAIGNYYTGGNQYSGRIDNVQTYNIGLPQSDIKRIMIGLHPITKG